MRSGRSFTLGAEFLLKLRILIEIAFFVFLIETLWMCTAVSRSASMLLGIILLVDQWSPFHKCCDELPEGDVKNHHDGKSEHDAGGGQVFMTRSLGFGNHFFDDNEDHRAGGEAEGVGQ